MSVFIDNAAGARERAVRADGHTFAVLSTSENPAAEARYGAGGAWLRRDVVSVPAGGWARLAFVADNPGVWRLGAAGAFHSASGEAIELFEALDALAGLDVPADHRGVCGMPAPSASASPQPSPSPLAAAPAGLAQLTTGQLAASIAAPLCALAGLFGARLLAARVPGCFGGSGGGAHALSKVQPGGV